MARVVGDPPRLTDEDLERLDRELETADAVDVVRWAVRTFGRRLSLAASMQDAVLIDIATRVDPAIDVVFIDTGYHFPETLGTLEAVRRHYGIEPRVLQVPRSDPPLWKTDPVNCCSAAKVQQLERALQGRLAWMSGLRRADSAARATAPIVARDRRGLVKVNPLATWTDLQVADYIVRWNVPYNPLLDRGYLSIGCAPCTRPVRDGEHKRSGRWPGIGKTECGLHL
ncbi:MAG TPA: phosphoadenylyl-sulfate reductase [Actinomycetota bacterium]|nr:phosphoadenylyl-sulfate reductase [Actinomycetota bacterium]